MPDEPDVPDLPEAYYLPVPGTDDQFDSTSATESPWDPSAQHGGPPAGLIGRAVDATTEDPPAFPIARITFDMLGAIPQGRMRIEARVVRPGRRVEMVEARLYAGDNAEERLAVSATAWRVRESPESTRHLVDPAPDLPPLPETGITSYFPGVPDTWGYGRSVDWRFVEGGLRGEAVGVARVWTRVRIPLVAGEETAPLHRLLVVADSTNGVSIRTPITRWWSIPNTCTVSVLRVPSAGPDGEWMWLDAATDVGPHGRGMATATMSDHDGVLAVIAQPLLVSPR